MSKMYLMCGLSGAGKTTFAKKFAEEHNCVYLGIDDFYACFAGANGIKSPWSDPDASFDVWIKYFYAIHELSREKNGKDVLIDTNAPTFVKRQQFIDWFPCFDEYNLIYIAVDEDLRYKNNLARGRVVPQDEMARMRDEFQPPVRSLDENMRCYIFPEKRWNNIMVYINKDNHFVPCKKSY